MRQNKYATRLDRGNHGKWQCDTCNEVVTSPLSPVECVCGGEFVRAPRNIAGAAKRKHYEAEHVLGWGNDE